MELDPNDDLIVVQLGKILTWMGQAEEGIEWILKAMRLNSYHSERFWAIRDAPISWPATMTKLLRHSAMSINPMLV